MKTFLVLIVLLTVQTYAQSAAVPSKSYDEYTFEVDEGRALVIQASVKNPAPACVDCRFQGQFRVSAQSNMIAADFSYESPDPSEPPPPPKKNPKPAKLKSDKFIVSNGISATTVKVYVPSNLDLSAWTLSTESLSDVQQAQPQKLKAKSYKSFKLKYGGPYKATLSTEAVQTDCNKPSIHGSFTYLSSGDYEFAIAPAEIFQFSVGCQPLPKPRKITISKTETLKETGWGYTILVANDFELLVTN